MMHLCVLKKSAGVTMHFITTDSVSALAQIRNQPEFCAYLIHRNKYETLKEEFDNFKFDAVFSTYNGIPDENMEEYFNKAQATLSKEMYKKLLKKIKNSNNFIENIFSVKNYRENARKYKIITVLGIKFRI